MKKTFTRLFALSMILLAGAACQFGDAPGTTEGPVPDYPEFVATLTEAGPEAAGQVNADSILHAINLRRAEAGVPGLVSREDLAGFAKLRSMDMSARAYTGHEDPATGENLLELMLAEMGYSGPAAELVYSSRTPPENLPVRLTEAWFEDPMHKALLLEPSFRFCGIGIAGEGGEWKVAVILTIDLPEESNP